ncbi:hypothetical protein BN1708_003073 [Verticillium longisporum]|uniref:Uncharacterized protein n=1 Tax=Verticillium longisporum TaxID=100787 RepID=A0A0G4L757_VERLO|nr:hypothetical protein BN1708_003073 [Verticillium longisporum]
MCKAHGLRALGASPLKDSRPKAPGPRAHGPSCRIPIVVLTTGQITIKLRPKPPSNASRVSGLLYGTFQQLVYRVT